MAAPPDDLAIRPLRPGDDPGALLDLSERAGTPLVTLRQAGLAAGGTPADDAALDAAFAATSYMLDAF